MAEIYSMNGDEIALGLQGCNVCDEAIQAAKGIAQDLGKPVRLEDDDGLWDVFPDGTVSEGDSWDAPAKGSYANYDEED